MARQDSYAAAYLGLVLALLLGAAAPARAETATFLHVAPESAPMRRALIIGGPLLEGSADDRLVLFYRVSWGSWRQLNMQFDPPDTWVTAIPADELSPAGQDIDRGYVEYYVVAFSSSGRRSYVYASPTAPTRVRLALKRLDVDDELRSLADGPAAGEPGPVDDAVPREAPRPAVLPSREEMTALAPVETKAPPKEAEAEPIQPRPREVLTFALTAERIRQLGLRSLAEAVQLMPGFSVSRDVQGFWRVTGRGRTSDAEIVVLLDGQRVNNPLDGRVDWEMPLTDVERIEARFAPDLPTELGPVFAVVSVTSTIRDGVGGGGLLGVFGPPLELGNHTYGGHVLGGHTWGRLRFSGGADFTTRAGYLRTVAVDAVPRDGIAGQTDDERIAGVARARLEYGFEGGSYLHLQLRASHEQRSTLVGAVDVLEPESRLRGDVGLAEVGGHIALGSWTIDSRLYADEQLTDRNLALFPAGAFVRPLTLPDGLFFRTAAGVTSAGLGVTASNVFGPLDTLRFGADAQRQAITKFQSNTTPATDSAVAFHLPGGVRFPAQVPDWATRWMAGLFVENVWRPLRVLTLTTGARGDMATGLGKTLFLPSGRLALALRVAPFMLLRAAASRATRLPTFDELLSTVPLPPSLNSGLPSGFDPGDLTRPVTLTAAEVGVDSVVGPEENRVTLRATGFVDLYDDAIVVIDEGQGYRFDNRAKGEQYVGAEGEVRYDRKNLVTAFANLSLVIAQDRAQAEVAPSFSFLTDVPTLRANTGVVLPIRNILSLATTLTFGSGRHNNTRSVIEVQRAWEIPPYLLLSATIRSVPIAGWLEIAASVYSVTLTGRMLADPVPRPDTLPGLLPREGLNGNLTVRAVY